jgi:hypothetical protein
MIKESTLKESRQNGASVALKDVLDPLDISRIF